MLVTENFKYNNFENIAIGKTFLVKNELFLKIAPRMSIDFNAICLSSGEPIFFNDEDLVIPTQTKIVYHI